MKTQPLQLSSNKVMSKNSSLVEISPLEMDGKYIPELQADGNYFRLGEETFKTYEEAAIFSFKWIMESKYFHDAKITFSTYQLSWTKGQ